MVVVGNDAPAWTFGLNPNIPGPRIPGVGTYNVAGRLESDSVGTHFSRIGTRPTNPRPAPKRLVFGTGVYVPVVRNQPQGAYGTWCRKCSHKFINSARTIDAFVNYQHRTQAKGFFLIC